MVLEPGELGREPDPPYGRLAYRGEKRVEHPQLDVPPGVMQMDYSDLEFEMEYCEQMPVV